MATFKVKMYLNELMCLHQQFNALSFFWGHIKMYFSILIICQQKLQDWTALQKAIILDIADASLSQCMQRNGLILNYISNLNKSRRRRQAKFALFYHFQNTQYIEYWHNPFILVPFFKIHNTPIRFVSHSIGHSDITYRLFFHCAIFTLLFTQIFLLYNLLLSYWHQDTATP